MSNYVIAHQKGGVGKTTIAGNLAIELSRAQTVRIIDLDTHQLLTAYLSKHDHKNIVMCSPGNKEELIKELKKEEGVLLVDVGGFDSDLSRYCILYASTVITPCSDSEVEIRGLLSFQGIIQELQEARPDIKPKVLLNRVPGSFGFLRAV